MKKIIFKLLLIVTLSINLWAGSCASPDGVLLASGSTSGSVTTGALSGADRYRSYSMTITTYGQLTTTYTGSLSLDSSNNINTYIYSDCTSSSASGTGNTRLETSTSVSASTATMTTWLAPGTYIFRVRQRNGNPNVKINATFTSKACSTSSGVKLNEVYVGKSGSSSTLNVIELYKSLSTTSLTNWSLLVDYSNGTTSRRTKLAAPTTVSNFPITTTSIRLYNGSTGKNSVSLLDASGNLVDSLSINGHNLINSGGGFCAAVNGSVTGSLLDYYRNVDGAGTWQNQTPSTIGRSNTCNNSGYDLLISNTPSDSVPLVGTNFTYTITVTNNSCTANATGNTVVNFPIPATLTYQSDDAGAASTWNAGTGILQWIIPPVSLPKLTSTTMVVTVKAPATPQTSISTTATIASTSPTDIALGNNAATSNIKVVTQNTVGFDSIAQTVYEADGTATASVSLDFPSGVDITIPYSVSGTGVSGTDYTNLANGDFFIAAGDPGDSVTFNLRPPNSTIDANKTIILTLGTPNPNTISGAVLDPAISQTIFTLTDVGISISNQTFIENNISNTVNIPITLSNTYDNGDVSVNYTIVEGTATNNASTGDFNATATGTLTFAAGDTVAYIPITIRGDTYYEADENFTIVLSSPTNAALINANATVTITNDDPEPTANIDLVNTNLSLLETAATSKVVFKLSQCPIADVTVPYTVVNNPSPTVIDHNLTNGSFTITATGCDNADPLTYSKSVDYNITANTKTTGDQNITVTLGTPSISSIVLGSDYNATITIHDDPLYTLLVDDDKVECPNAPFTTITSALAKASAGDTIKICHGTYTENVVVNINDLNITSQSGTASDVIVKGSSGNAFTINKSNVGIKNLSIIQNVSNSRAILADNAANLILNNLIINYSNGSNEAIKLQNASTTPTFTNLDITSDQSGINMDGANGFSLSDIKISAGSNGGNYGIYGWNINTASSLSRITLQSGDNAIYIVSNQKTTLTDINANSTIARAVYIPNGTFSLTKSAWASNTLSAQLTALQGDNAGAFTVQNTNAISTADTVMKFSNVGSNAFTFTDNNITGNSGNTYGVYIDGGSSASLIQRNIIKNAITNQGLRLLNNPTFTSKISNNCFMNNLTHNANVSNAGSSQFNGNFWGTTSGLAVTPDYTDAATQNKCSLIPTDTIVINSYGQSAGGVFPIMQLWINGTKVGEATVSSTVATDYAFPVFLPDIGSASIDVVFTNDAVIGTEDRNLIVNSVLVRGQFLLPTDPGVILDKGTGSAAFDGINTIPGQAGIYWNGALRFNVNLTRPAIAEYHMEDISWNGSTGELKDTAGYTGGAFNGKAIGTPLPIPIHTSTTGRCGYASLSGPTAGGGAFDITGLPVSATANAQTTVAFWMYWDGTNSVMPIGWNTHDLWIVSGHFGFNTGNSDIYGISSTGLANRWVHVVAIFTNNNVTADTLYIDGVPQILTQRLSTPNNTTGKVQSTLRISGWQRDTGYRFSGLIDEVKVFTGAISQDQVSTLYTETHTCPDALPIADYRLDDILWNGTLGEVKDSSGFNINGQSIGATTIDKGKVCSAGDFTHSKDYVDVANSKVDSLKNEITVMGWINLKAYSSYNYIYSNTRDVYNGTAPYKGFELAVGNGGSNQPRFTIWGADGNRSIVYAKPTTTVPLNTWAHIAGTFDGKQQKIYVNGVLDQTLNYTGQIASPASFAGTLGALAFQRATYEANETLDEVKVFDSAVSATQIASIYANENAGKNWDGTARTCPVLPIADYHMDECSWNGTAGEVVDSSLYNFNAKAVGMTTTKNGKLNLGGDFTATSTTDYITLPNTVLNGQSDVTVSTWIKTSNTLNQAILSGSNTSADNEFLIFPRSVSFDIYIKASPISFAIPNIADNNWHNLVVTRNGTSGSVCAYVDGNLSTSGCKTAPNGALSIGSGGLIIGQEQDSVGGSFDASQAFNGYMDEFKIYNRVLSSTDIATFYTNEFSNMNFDGSTRILKQCLVPITDYHMDECSWNGTNGEVKDSSGNYFNGTSINGTSTASAKLCYGGNFNGTSNYIKIPISTSTVSNKQFSVSLWTKFNSFNHENQMLYIRNSGVGTAQRFFYLSTWRPDGLYDGLHVGVSNTGGTWGRGYSMASTFFTANQWYHVVAVIDTVGGSINVYRNGALMLTQAIGIGDILNTQYELWIGASADGTPTHFLDGQIDEVKIFNSLLNSSDVSKIYNYENSQYNYDNSTRTCPVCIIPPNPTYAFDAWDKFRSLSDRNISTKIVGKSFDLNISSLDTTKTALQDFNGTVCTKIVDTAGNAISGWNKTLFNSVKSASTTFTLNRAIGGSDSAGVKLYWKKNIDSVCPIVTEDNTSLASDRFSVRPASFNITASNAVAGSNFDINFTAPIYGAATGSTDYNETGGGTFDVTIVEHNASCAMGTFNPVPTTFNFINGSKTITTRYSEVGMLDLNISDMTKPCASRYTKVDCDDANVSDGTSYTADLLPIGLSQKSITVTPHHFDVNATLTNFGGGTFTYLSTDLNMSAQLDLNITAKNAEGNTTKNYTSGCYSKDTTVTLPHSVVPSPLNTILYHDSLTLSDSNITKANPITSTYIASKFNQGSVTPQIIFNFDRNSSKPLNPFDFNITSATAADVDITGTTTPMGIAKFVYGRVRAYDITTNVSPVDVPVEFEVYSTTSSGFVIGMPQNVLHWYRNLNHDAANEGNVIKGGFSAGVTDTAVNTSAEPANGIQIVTVTSTQDKTVHLDISTWLWYSSKYGYLYSGACTQHPCFNYDYTDATVGVKGVNSGTFNGSDFQMAPAKNITNKGVKIFR